MPPEHEDGPACLLEESRERAYRWGLRKKIKERARLGERARDSAQLVAGFLRGLLLRLKLQDKQTSLTQHEVWTSSNQLLHTGPWSR